MAGIDQFPRTAITDKITRDVVRLAEKNGHYLGTDERIQDPRTGKVSKKGKLTTNQLRRFFGEVKRQQMQGYDETQFILLKPKLAYAVGRDKGATKIDEFYQLMSPLIDAVTDQKSFENFIQVFEAVVAYHKATEETGL